MAELALVSSCALGACVDDGALDPVEDGDAQVDEQHDGSPEPIFLMAGITLDSTTRVLTISGTTQNDVVWVGVVTGLTGTVVSVELNEQVADFPIGSVASIVVKGYEGDDNVTISSTVWLAATVDGGDGNDSVRGGSGPDRIIGGYGSDTLYGGTGNDVVWGSGHSDTMYGGDGDDVLAGNGGNDKMYGGNGRDRLNGGSGDDELVGDSGQDLLVAIGAGTDTIAGGYQWDNFWIDAADVLTDVSTNEDDLGYVHRVTAFDAVRQGAGTMAFAVGLEPNGEDLLDPLPLVGQIGLSRSNFEHNPLFAASGPSKEDVFQGDVGDCYLMAVLAGFAMVEPEFIRKMVTDLGDGTYAVRFYRSGLEHHIRVDAELWVNLGIVSYAKPGTGGASLQDGALWSPIVEKAYAFFRRDEGTYDSIASGDNTLHEHIGAAVTPWRIEDDLSSQTVVDWVNAGSPSGAVRTAVQTGATNLLSWIRSQRAAGKVVIVGGVPGITDRTAIRNDGANSTYRRGRHIHTVDRVLSDAAGTPTGLVIRNPYGGDITLTNLTVIYFCLGQATMWEDARRAAAL